jgi:hypothetical protein
MCQSGTAGVKVCVDFSSTATPETSSACRRTHRAGAGGKGSRILTAYGTAGPSQMKSATRDRCVSCGARLGAQAVQERCSLTADCRLMLMLCVLLQQLLPMLC